MPSGQGIGADVSVEPALAKSPDYRVNIHVAVRGAVTVFVKIGIGREFELAKMSEINTFRVLFRHFRKVVELARAERPRTERNTVMQVGNGGKKTVVVLFATHDSRKPENIPRRIVGVNRHIHSSLVTRGHNSVKEIYEIFK